ncbi:MAG TPA: VWA domain-containing protein, partial [Candidatus Dormibacteraeota bacterium]|nr:VWA domain-containing protein [Candidatus Dormibacteraeota bacterium]
RPRQSFPSTLLWRRAVADRQANAPWQRLRFSWLLLLQLLAAALLTGAAIRPALAVHSELSADTVVVVDASATMQATDVRPSRFEAARTQARELISKLGSRDRLTLIAMGPEARLLASATGDQGTLSAALDRLQPGNGPADLAQALALAASAAGRAADSRLVLISDGITLTPPAPVTMPFPVEYREVGVSGENLAVTTLAVHPQADQRTAFVHVQNFGRQRHHADLDWRVDGHLADARGLDLAAGAGSDLVFPLPPGAQTVEAALTGSDLLAVDDAAWGIASPGRVRKVELVTAGNRFMQRALGLRPDLSVTVVAPAAYRPDPAVDLWVFDGFLPADLPPAPVWVVDPPAGRLGAGAMVAPGRVRATDPSDPLLQDVDLRDVHVARAHDLRATTFGGRSVLEGDAGPLLLVRDVPTPAALLAFDLHDADLPLRAAFPLLVDRVSAFLLPSAVPARAYRPDETVLLTPPAGATGLRVTLPSGRTADLHPARGAGAVAFGDTDQLGVYRVVPLGAGGP